MKNFPEFDFESMGSIENFQYIPVDDVKNVVKPNSTLEITTAIELNDGKAIYTGNAIYDSLDFIEPAEIKNAGVVYKTKVSGMIPKLTSEYLALFEEMTRRRHYVFVKDANGSTRMVGYENGAQFLFSQKIEKNAAGLNGFLFEFTSESAKPSPFYVI